MALHHARSEWNKALFDIDKQLVADIQSSGGSVLQVHGDDMASIALWNKCCSEVVDESFSAKERMLMSTSGWVCCKVHPRQISVDGKSATAQPCRMHDFVRCLRYLPVSPETHYIDLLTTLQDEDPQAISDNLLIGVDNSADYAV